MNELVDGLVGRGLSVLGDAALASFSTYRAIFAPPLLGPARDALDRARARAAFWHARRRVPAYRDFLQAHGALRPRAFGEIPITTKDNYIRAHTIEALCAGGALPSRGVVLDESSGSAGTATSWARGPEERAACSRLIQFAVRATFGPESFVLLNAFALGPWATGMHVSMSLLDRCIVKSVGPDAQKIVNSLKELGPRYRYVIAGYPPFLKSLVERADLDFRAYDICAVVGGEGMSEPLRAALLRAFRRVYSSFGASDLEINLATENDFTIALRQELMTNAALARDLYGRADGLPMVFQYDPLNVLVETDADRRMLFTLNRLENVSPRVRYDLGDRGVVRPFVLARSILEDHRIALPGAPLALPLLFHFGRAEHAVAFYGCKVTPADVQSALLRVPALTGALAEFALHAYEDEHANKRLEIWLELCREAPPIDEGALTDLVLARLAEENQDFRESLRMIDPRLRPTLRTFRAGESPLPHADARIKKRYIV